jgi:hypothetical protein
VFDTQIILSAGDPRLRLKWVQRIPFGGSFPSIRGVMTGAPSTSGGPAGNGSGTGGGPLRSHYS